MAIHIPHNYKYVVSKVYKKVHTNKSLNTIFNKNANIRDYILGCHVFGLERIRHYYNDVDYLYNQVELINLLKISDKTVFTEWERTKYDTNYKIYGYDTIVFFENKIANIVSKMDIEKTIFWTEKVDYE
jgi:hypothetical protein